MSSLDPEDPRTKEMLRRIRADHEAIISGIGLVTRVWATLESSLYQLFMVLGRFAGPSPGPDIAGVIFFTPNNTETRIELVNKLVTYHCQMHSIGELDDRLTALWDTKIKGKIDTLKNTRNAIVHGAIISSYRSGDQKVRLSPTFGDILRLYPFYKRQVHPGLGPSDLKTHEQAVWRVIERTQKLSGAFDFRMRLQFGPDREVAIRELHELLLQLETDWNSQNSPDQEQPDKTDPSRASPA
jgi:hypothetical protein